MRLRKEVQEVPRRLRRPPSPPTTTFDFEGARLDDVGFEDIDSSADLMAVATNSEQRGVHWSRIRHLPFRRHDGGVNWAAVAAVAGVVSAVAAVLALLMS